MNCLSLLPTATKLTSLSQCVGGRKREEVRAVVREVGEGGRVCVCGGREEVREVSVCVRGRGREVGMGSCVYVIE